MLDYQDGRDKPGRDQVGIATAFAPLTYEACQAAKEQLIKTKLLLSGFSQFEIATECYAKGLDSAQRPK